MIHVGLSDRLINKQIHTYTVQALQSTVICHQNQNVHIQLHIRKTQLSINQVSVYTRPKFFPLYHLFAGKIHIAHFQLYQTKTFQTQMKSFRGYDPRSLKRWYHTPYSQYIYIYLRCIHIYCYLEQSCREESLSMLVQHGKPPSLSGFSS